LDPATPHAHTLRLTVQSLRKSRRMNTRRFNRLCLVLALGWLAVSVPFGIKRNPTIPDFGQFYVGGLIAKQGAWDALYPIPAPASRDNAGLIGHSQAKPLWKSLSRQHRVYDYTHFILPPPSALLFIPFTTLSYDHAYWTWIFVLILSTWGVAVLAGRMLRKILGHSSRHEGMLALLVVLSPMTARAIRVANVSPAIALLISFALLSFLRQEQRIRSIAGGVAAILIGALLKYATLILAPLLVAARRWRTLIWLIGAGGMVLLSTLALTGWAPFAEFHERILPTLSRPSAYQGNQSLPGLLVRVFGRPLPSVIAASLMALRMAALVAILILIGQIPHQRWRNPVLVCAGAASLLSWLMIFSPIAWEHWPIFLTPVWGWLLWEARKPGLRRAAGLTSLALMYVPAGIFQVPGFVRIPLVLPEPLNSFQLIGVVLVLVLSTMRLSRFSGKPSPRQEISQMRKLDEVKQAQQHCADQHQGSSIEERCDGPGSSHA